jgi:hypothetical protein
LEAIPPDFEPPPSPVLKDAGLAFHCSAASRKSTGFPRIPTGLKPRMYETLRIVAPPIAPKSFR